MNVINFTGDAWEARVGDGDPYEDALRIADAVGELAHELNPDARVYVGFDSRSLSRSLAPEMAEVVAGHGITCYVSDACCPSCVLAEAVRLDSKAIGGIMLTAGNKPADYFGIGRRVARHVRRHGCSREPCRARATLCARRS